MAITVDNIYGSYSESNFPFVNSYGVADDEYGVIPADPFVYNFLLNEDGTYLLQENGDKIYL